MAASVGVRRPPQDDEMINFIENGEPVPAAIAEPLEDPTTLHERLVTYVHSLNDESEPRCSVWMEHSYARAGSVASATPGTPSTAGTSDTLSATEDTTARALLVRWPRTKVLEPAKSDDEIDIEFCEVPNIGPPDPPYRFTEGEEEADDEEEEEWEKKLEGLAPTQECRELAVGVTRILHGLRLSRLCGAGGRRDETRAHARRLRALLAPYWASGVALPPAQRPPAWMHSALCLTLPRHYRVVYTELISELRRWLPQLTERLQAASLPPPAAAPCPKPGPAVMPMSSRPLLVWVGCGRDKTDQRWERRLRALLPTHYIRLHHGGEPREPESWCMTAVSAARAALASLDADRESCSLLALGGAGAGAALALQLAAEDRRVRALVLLAPPVLTAEGLRVAPDDPITDIRVPTMAVIPECGQTVWWSAASEATRGAARLLLVGGADDALRLPHARRRALRLPQHALDAAVTEECARWLTEVAEGGDKELRGSELSPPRKKIKITSSKVVVEEDNEYSHLPPATPPRPLGNSNRSIEIIEGRLVSRVCGKTPLALVPPRRAASPLVPDIMSLPIVFADDEPLNGNAQNDVPSQNQAPPRRRPHLHLKKKHLKYKKVIVAKRPSATNGPVVVRGEARLVPRRLDRM